MTLIIGVSLILKTIVALINQQRRTLLPASTEEMRNSPNVTAQRSAPRIRKRGCMPGHAAQCTVTDGSEPSYLYAMAHRTVPYVPAGHQPMAASPFSSDRCSDSARCGLL
jgi:hypothetical protein